MKKINDLRKIFEKYILESDRDLVYKEKLINHFNNNIIWISLRNLDITEYNKKYNNLKGKAFYLKLKEEGYEILESPSGNRDAFSNVHKYLKEVIGIYFKPKGEYIEHIYHQIHTIYTEEEKENLNNTLVIEEASFNWNLKPKNKCDLEITPESLKYKRDINVAKNALVRAQFLCEYNNKDKLFLRKGSQDKFYTEAHHLIPLSKNQEFEYSLDIEENIVSLCSHCHNLLHYGRYEDKRNILEKLFKDRQNALSKCGIHISLPDLLNYYK